MSLAALLPNDDPGLNAVPPAMAVGPLLPKRLFVGLPARLAGRLLAALPIVDLAFAAPVLAVVFAVSIIFLKKPDFFALGAFRPPSTPADSMGSLFQSATGVTTGWLPEAWLSW